jgi:hypothetical protein
LVRRTLVRASLYLLLKGTPYPVISRPEHHQTNSVSTTLRYHEILTKVGFLQKKTLIPHALNPDYVRLNMGRADIENSIIFNNITQDGQIIQKKYQTTKEQKEALYAIFDLYNNDNNIKNNNISKLMEEIEKRLYLKLVKDWWNNINANFDITSVGKVLAHTNAQRCDKSLPPLN